MKPEPSDFSTFVRESNRIEGIKGVRKSELIAHADLIAAHVLTIPAVAMFVRRVAGASLRSEQGMNVRVGDHLPPPGGPAVQSQLDFIIARANRGDPPWPVHVAYETLHPFMDGNGRSGRAIWLWQMLRQQRAPWALRMGFLHLFYYQTLATSGRGA